MEFNIEQIKTAQAKAKNLMVELVDINASATKEVISAFGVFANLNTKTDLIMKSLNSSVDTVAENVKKAIKFEGYSFEGYKG